MAISENTEQTYYRWRKQFGGINSSDAKRLKALEKEELDKLRRSTPSSQFSMLRASPFAHREASGAVLPFSVDPGIV